MSPCILLHIRLRYGVLKYVLCKSASPFLLTASPRLALGSCRHLHLVRRNQGTAPCFSWQSTSRSLQDVLFLNPDDLIQLAEGPDRLPIGPFLANDERLIRGLREPANLDTRVLEIVTLFTDPPLVG